MDNILYETTKHPIYVIMKICEYLLGYMIFLIGLFVLDYIYPIGGYFWLFGILGIVVCGIFSYIYFDRFNKSKLVITNNRVYMIVQNGLWSSYEMSIYRSNIKDFAYTRNHILHEMLDYGNLWIRSGTNKESEFYASEVPNVGYIYNIINFLYTMPTTDRKNISKLPQEIAKSTKNKKNNINNSDEKLPLEILSKIKKVKGITGGVVLNNIDREYIGNHEEERNHGVYECIRKKYLLCISHDSNFRNPDADIVVNYNGKVIFPAVPFHEVQLSSTISSSPSILVHKYLCDRFDAKLGEEEATILIGFDDL